jgi:hypothetical protein
MVVKKKKVEEVKVSIVAPKIDEKTMSKETALIQSQVHNLVVVDEVSKVQAGEILIAVKAYIKRWTGVFKPQKDALNAAKQVILDQEKKFIGPAEALEKELKTKISDYIVAKEARIAEETRLANAKLEKQAAKDREKLEKQAAKAEAKGDTEKADALRQEAELTTAVTVVGESAVEAQSGLALKDDIEITVTDLRAFFQFVINSTDSSLDPMITVKIGGVKKFLQFHDFKDTPPGLSIKKIKAIAASAGGGL